MDEPSTPPLFQVTDLASVLLRPILQLNLLPFLSQPRDWINKPSGAENDYIIVKYSVKLRAIIPDSLFLCCRGHAKRFGPFLLLVPNISCAPLQSSYCHRLPTRRAICLIRDDCDTLCALPNQFWEGGSDAQGERAREIRTVEDKCIISHSLDKHNNNNQQICKTMSHITRGPSIISSSSLCRQIGVAPTLGESTPVLCSLL